MQHDQFEQLLIENGKFLFRYLVKLGASRSDAEDIVQDTFYQVLLSYQSIHPSKLKSWLFQVAINRYYDFCRKRKRQAHIPLESLNLVVTEELIDEKLLRNEKQTQIRQQLHQLKPTYQTVLILKYAVQLSYKEIANMLGEKEEKIKTWLYRARKELKRKLEENQNE
ncbi:RNA polymerase sigma factor [Shimazuella kribbensis]|uniref:RNA polymerase sigma factor n=1 Tax=Shimazuella kribbensis TaxID=139808 RepID=UPI00041D5616|nr:RNA polymerase sigma factor [Shimazuella kribbensis]